MQTIKTSYAQRFPDNQPFSEPVEILDLDFALSPVKEACAFQRRLDTRLTFSQLRQQICLDYDLGFVTAENTIQRLWDNGLIRTAEDLAFLVSAGVRALAEGERP